MRWVVASLIFCGSAFAANIPNQTSFLLDAGKNTFTVTNSGSAGGSKKITINPGSFTRLGITYTPNYYQPPTSTTYTACADPCGEGATASVTTFNQQWGISYPWVELLQANGTAFSPRQLQLVTSAYAANSCDIPGALPMIEPSATTTNPLPMPREVGGGDCFVDKTQLSLVSGHAYTSVLYFLRLHNMTYNNRIRWTGKVSVKLNSGAWITPTNSSTDLTIADEMEARNAFQGLAAVDFTLPPYKIAGPDQVREWLLTIPDGTIAQGDTTLTVRLRSNGTDGNSTFWRALEAFPVEGTGYGISQIVCVSNVCTASSVGSNFANGDSVLIRNMAGPGRALNGPQLITTGGANSFIFTPHAAGSGGSRPAQYVVADGTYAPPINRNPVQNEATDQITAYANRMLVSASAFAYPDGSVPVDDTGGDASAGATLFKSTQLYNANLLVGNFRLASTTSCESCHAKDGWDLSYFKVSNNSIRMRSLFHGFTFTQGNDIAAYIRSLDTKVSPPYAAYLWNPPMQQGAGQDHYTWKRSDSTLTKIACASNVCIATVPDTTDIRVHDPVYIYGATVDTDLNTQTLDNASLWHVTSKTSTTITFTTTNVTDNSNYNESTLVVNMFNMFTGGAGIDAQLVYPFADQRTAMNFSDQTKWALDNYLNPSLIPSHYQLPDWNRWWMPVMFPDDIVPGASYTTNSTPYTNLQTIYAATPGNYASISGAGYGTSLLTDWRTFDQSDTTQNGAQNLPTSTKYLSYQGYAGLADGSPAVESRYSFQKLAMVAQFTLATKYGTLGMGSQWATATFGSTSATACYPPFYSSIKAILFNGTAPHKSQSTNPGDGLQSTFDIVTNAWYLSAPGPSSGQCNGTPDEWIDSGYIRAFNLQNERSRPTGYEGFLLPSINVVQAGRGRAELAYHSGVQSGQDFFQTLNVTVNPLNYGIGSYWWMTSGQWTEYVRAMIQLQLATWNSRNTAYWQNVMTGIGGQTCSATLVSAWSNGNGTMFCDTTRLNLTYYAMFLGAGDADVLALQTIGSAIWPSADWNIPLTASHDGDVTNAPSCSGCGTSGSHSITLTFSNAGGNYGCPVTYAGQVMNTIVAGTGVGDIPEIVSLTGGTCAAPAGNGTLTATSVYAHTGTIRVTYGCSNVYQDTNALINYPSNLNRTWRCSNMF